MYLNISKMMFIIIMVMSTLFSISSISFLNMWMGMEVNLIAFIPLMMMKNNNFNMESMMKYFLIQSISSANFIFSVNLLISFNKWFTNFSFSYFLIYTIINLSLFMKMGAAPFHFWFPKTMKGLSWLNCFILSTWQKIIPMLILSYCYLNILMMIFIVFSSLIGSIMGLNQTSLQMIMSYSSINHISWLLTSLILNLNLWMIYFTIYTILIYILMLSFNFSQMFHLNQIFSNKSSHTLNYFIFLNLLSLGGLPPFLGFLPKWLVINSLMNNSFYLIAFILIMTSLINLFYYIRITYSFMIMNFWETKFSLLNLIKNNLIILMNIISIFSMPLIFTYNFII